MENIKDKFFKSDNERYVYFIGEDSPQIITNKDRQKRFYDLKDDEIIYLSGLYWKGITNKDRQKRFYDLKDEYFIFCASQKWKGITKNDIRKRFWDLEGDYMCSSTFLKAITKEDCRKRFLDLHEKKHERNIFRIGKCKCIKSIDRKKKFFTLQDPDIICSAGLEWKGITYEDRKKKFLELKDEYSIFHIGRNWPDLKPEDLEKKFYELKNDKYFGHACTSWKNLPIKEKKIGFHKLKDELLIVYVGSIIKIDNEDKQKKFYELKDKNCIYSALQNWTGLTEKEIAYGLMKLDQSQIEIKGKIYYLDELTNNLTINDKKNLLLK